MTGYVCTVASSKGGVGKTTTVANLGLALSAAGHEVVLVDADLGMPNLATALGVESGGGIHRVLAGDATLEESLVRTEGGLAVLPGETSIAAFAEADPAGLREIIGTLREQFDAVVIDTGGGLSRDVAIAVAEADGVVLVSTPDAVAIDDTLKTADVTSEADTGVLGVLLVRALPGDVPDVDRVQAALDVPLLGVVPAGDFDTAPPLLTHRPDSDMARAYRQLADLLAVTFFDGHSPGELEYVHDPDWFESADADERADDTGEDEAVGDTDDGPDAADEDDMEDDSGEDETEGDTDQGEGSGDADGDDGIDDTDGSEVVHDTDGDDGLDGADEDEYTKDDEDDEGGGYVRNLFGI